MKPYLIWLPAPVRPVTYKSKTPTLNKETWSWPPVSFPVSPIPHFSPRNSSSPSLDIDECSDSYEMVQTYGVVPETAVEPNIIDTDEARALLADPNAPSKRNRHTDGHATLTSCISNLLNTIIGSGAYFTTPSGHATHF